MAKQTIGIGTVANDGTGDPLRTAFDKVNDNNDFLFAQTGWASYIDNDYTSGSPFTLSSGVDTILPNRVRSVVSPQLPDDVKCFYYGAELDITGVTGTFEEGETITGGTSGATADILEIFSSTNLRLSDVNGTFTTETITGGTSGATATVSTVGNGKIVGRTGDNLDIMIYFKAVPSAINASIDIWIDIGGSIGELYRQTIYFRGATQKGVLFTMPSAYTLDTWEANGGTIYANASVDIDIHSINFNFDRSHKAR